MAAFTDFLRTTADTIASATCVLAPPARAASPGASRFFPPDNSDEGTDSQEHPMNSPAVSPGSTGSGIGAPNYPGTPADRDTGHVVGRTSPCPLLTSPPPARSLQQGGGRAEDGGICLEEGTESKEDEQEEEEALASTEEDRIQQRQQNRLQPRSKKKKKGSSPNRASARDRRLEKAFLSLEQLSRTGSNLSDSKQKTKKKLLNIIQAWKTRDEDVDAAMVQSTSCLNEAEKFSRHLKAGLPECCNIEVPDAGGSRGGRGGGSDDVGDDNRVSGFLPSGGRSVRHNNQRTRRQRQRNQRNLRNQREQQGGSAQNVGGRANTGFRGVCVACAEEDAAVQMGALEGCQKCRPICVSPEEHEKDVLARMEAMRDSEALPLADSEQALQLGLGDQQLQREQRYCDHHRKLAGFYPPLDPERTGGTEEKGYVEDEGVDQEGLLDPALPQLLAGQVVKVVMQRVLEYLGCVGMADEAPAAWLEERRMLQAVEIQVRQALAQPSVADDLQGVAQRRKDAAEDQAKADGPQSGVARGEAEQKGLYTFAKAGEHQRQQRQQQQDDESKDPGGARGSGLAATGNGATGGAGGPRVVVGQPNSSAKSAVDASAGSTFCDNRTAGPPEAIATVAKLAARVALPTKRASGAATENYTNAEKIAASSYSSKPDGGEWLWPAAFDSTAANVTTAGGNLNKGGGRRNNTSSECGAVRDGARQAIASGTQGTGSLAAAAVRPPALGRIVWIGRATAAGANGVNTIPLGHWKTFRQPAKWEKMVTAAIAKYSDTSVQNKGHRLHA